MTVPAYTGPNTSVANGVTVVFPYSFKLLAAADLLVTVNGLPRTLGTHYTVTGVGNAGGGDVVFITPPTSSALVVRKRNMPYIRATNYLNLGDLLAATLNDDQDAPVMMLQQLAADSMQLVPDPENGGFVWDAQGNRIIHVGDAIGDTDAVNLGQMQQYVEEAGSGGVSVSPKGWGWEGNDNDTDFPIIGADVSDPLFYDVAMEQTAGAGDYLVLRPGEDFTILTDLGPANAAIRLTAPPADGIRGFAVLRGYARPFAGPTPITTTAFNVVSLNANTVLDGSYHNSLIVVNSGTDVTLTIRANTGSGADWQRGEFFSVLQSGTGKVHLAAQAPGVLAPPSNFLNETRGMGCIVSATCLAPDADSWASAGDLLRQSANPDVQCFPIEDRSVLIGTNIAVGTGKASLVLPYGMALSSIADGGCYASLAVAQGVGTVLTVDVNRNGVSILATKLTFDNNEKTTRTAATPAVYDVDGGILSAGDEITIDVDQVGTALAKGLTVYLVGRRI